MNQQDLIAENTRLREACLLAQSTFERYAKLHSEKSTKEGNAKAKSNLELAQKMAEALPPSFRAIKVGLSLLNEFRDRISGILSETKSCYSLDDLKNICIEEGKALIRNKPQIFEEAEIFYSEDTVSFVFIVAQSNDRIVLTMEHRSSSNKYNLSNLRKQLTSALKE